MNRSVWVALMATVVVGCSTGGQAVLVPDATGTTPVSAVGLTCGKPFELKQDCSNWSGATKAVKVGGISFKVAGNASGTVVLLMGTTEQGTRGYTSNLAYDAVKRTLSDAGVKIVKVTPVISADQLFGYVLETDAPAYSVLDKYKTG